MLAFSLEGQRSYPLQTAVGQIPLHMLNSSSFKRKCLNEVRYMAQLRIKCLKFKSTEVSFSLFSNQSSVETSEHWLMLDVFGLNFASLVLVKALLTHDNTEH